jgi:hypothetical protein
VIVAYCDRCGEQIPADEAAGCRLLVGKQEVSWHLCEQHRIEMMNWTEGFLRAHEWRVVK